MRSSSQEAASAGSVVSSASPSAPSVLVFDVNETLLDIGSLATLFVPIFGDPQVLREWFGQLALYSMATTLCGLYVDFFTLGQGVLQMLADSRHVDITDADVHRLKDAMLTMPAYPDVEDGLSALRDNGFRLVTLTNSPPNPHGPTPLDHAGLGRFFERQFSVDTSGVFKPSTQLYRHVASQLSVPPSACMMIAAHAWDTIGAQSAGFSAAFIARPGNAALPVPGLPQPTLIAADLNELAQQLGPPGGR